jgi:hypothetical protein
MTPEKMNNGLTLAERAARLNQAMDHDLPAIEEAADKENDTFATGGPLQALKRAGMRREAARQKRESSANSARIHSNSNDRSGLRSADPSSAKKDLYKMYREPSDRESLGIGNLVRNGIPPKHR